MRVTNSMLVSNFMNDLNTNINRLDKINRQLASGKKFAHISDDPVAYIYSQEAKYKLDRLSHYQMGVNSASQWLVQVEAGVSELNELMKSAIEACVDTGTDVKSEDDRKNVAEYIGQLRDHLLTTLNATYGDKYVYGGYNTTGNTGTGSVDGPFTLDSNGNLMYNDFNLSDPDLVLDLSDPTVTASMTQTEIDEITAKQAEMQKLRSDVLKFDIGPGLNIEATINGIDLVMFETVDENGNKVTKNLFGLLDEVYTAASEGKPSSVIAGYLPELHSAQNHLLTKIAEIGGRTNRLDLMYSRYEQDEINYTQMLSDAEDAEYAEVIMNQKMAEAVYQAALAAGSQIIQPTLMDFLR